MICVVPVKLLLNDPKNVYCKVSRLSEVQYDWPKVIHEIGYSNVQVSTG